MANYKQIIYILTLLLWGFVFNKSVADTHLTGRIITTRDGLSSNLINDLVQDDNGFIWLGTANGLCRYDGYTFVNYPTIGCGEGKTNGHVGTFHLDHDNGLLWIRTATFNYACYDLRQQRFVDFTGSCNPQKTFERFCVEENGMWLYEASSGVRHVTYRKGKFECVDYTQENGGLPPGKVNRIKNDQHGNVWIMTDNGLLRYHQKSGLKTIVNKGSFLMCCFYNGKSFFLTKDYQILVFDEQGAFVRTLTIPSAFCDFQAVNTSIVWQDKWVIMTRKSILTMD